MTPPAIVRDARLWIASGLLGAALLLGCAAKTTTTATTPVVELSSISPVYFQSGSTALSEQDDYFAVASAVENLKKDANVYLLLVGYADSSGDPAANAALSLERAQTIRSLIISQAGVAPDRILVVALGEEANTDDLQMARRVEFLFHVVDEGVGAPSTSAILAAAEAAALAPAVAEADIEEEDTGDADEDADEDTGDADDEDTGDEEDTGEEDKPKREKKEKKSRSSKEKEQLDIIPTGIAEFDTFFGQVQPLLNSLRSASSRINEANTNLNEVMGLAADADPAEALSELVESAKGSVKITMDGTRPTVTVEPSASGQVQQGVQAVNGLVQAVVGAVSDLAQLPQQAQALVAQAKALPSQIPTAVKSAGLSMGEMATVTKAVKQNVKVTAGLPGEVTDVLQSSKDTLQLVTSSFK